MNSAEFSDLMWCIGCCVFFICVTVIIVVAIRGSLWGDED